MARFMLAHHQFCKNTSRMDGKESKFIPHRLDFDYFTVTGVDHKCSREAESRDFKPARTGTGPPILNGNVYTQGVHMDAEPVLGFERAPARMRASIPQALHSRLKFIVLLREPLSRDLSFFNHVRGMNARWGFCPETQKDRGASGYNHFLAEMVRCSKVGAHCSNCMRYRLMQGNYARLLKGWFSVFHRRQFFIIQSDTLDEQKAGLGNVSVVLRKLGDFLGVPKETWEPCCCRLPSQARCRQPPRREQVHTSTPQSR